MYSLYLYPEEPIAAQLSATGLGALLADHEIIASNDTSADHPAGARLMEFINFLGCSPVVADGNSESWVRIHYFAERRAMGGDSVVAIRYPGCGHVIDHPDLLIDNYPGQRQWRCPECASSGDIENINWRKSAGFGGCFIEISGIFPREALPTDSLLAILRSESLVEWRWFYSRSSHADL